MGLPPLTIRDDENQPPAHKCPADECQEMVAHHLLMCRYHWKLVPFNLRKAVDRTWKMGRGAGSKEHITACRAATEAVNSATEKTKGETA